MAISSDFYTWSIICAAGAVTVLARASFIVLPPETRVPAWLQRSLKFVAVAVLPAIILPDVLFRDVQPGLVFNSYRVIAAIIAMLVAWKTRSIFATLGAGMITLWLLQYFKPF